MASASAQIAQSDTDLGSRTEVPAAALEETLAPMEELGATVQRDTAAAANSLHGQSQHLGTPCRRSSCKQNWVLDLAGNALPATVHIATSFGSSLRRTPWCNGCGRSVWLTMGRLHRSPP